MNPYEMPSSMTVRSCLQHWGTPRFEEIFLSELTENENNLPLQDMCLSGGSPSSDDWAELNDFKIEVNKAGEITGSFHVSFTEESPTGCRDSQWKDKRSGRIQFRLKRADGTVTFEPPRIRREYEKDEF
jgi:hypothetical protein